eukprot:TRINITY_DN33517_c0_g1_i1.p1 TRINITY_DN33517_c0_g1~~TRINITY_DN33517_c0_g1_i1.p1  ORF type:complete len:1444 (-),score=244.59 TRINITY_DN33517_c0_g1_i1:153-4484(-)
MAALSGSGLLLLHFAACNIAWFGAVETRTVTTTLPLSVPTPEGRYSTVAQEDALGAVHRCCDDRLTSLKLVQCANSSNDAVSGSVSQDRSSRRLHVLQVSTSSEGYVALAAAVNAAWTERFGHKLFVHVVQANKNEVWRAGKVYLLNSAFSRDDSNAEYFLYLDTDVVLADFSKDTFQQLLHGNPSAELLLSREPLIKASRAAKHGGNDYSSRPQDFNNGVMLVRNSAWSKRFVAEWDRRLRAEKDLNDQEMLQVLYDANFAGAKDKMAVLEPGAVNSEMRIPVAGAGQRVVHLGGIPNIVREEVFTFIRESVCSGKMVAFGGSKLQGVFIDSMRRAADATRPTGNKAEVNGWVQIRQRLSLALESLGRTAEAAEHSRQVWERRRELFGAASRDALTALWHFVSISRDVTALTDAWDSLRRLHGAAAECGSGVAARHLGEALMATGRHSEALKILGAAISRQAACTPADGVDGGVRAAHVLRAAALNNIGLTYMNEKRSSEGELILRQAAREAADELTIQDLSAFDRSSSEQIVQNVVRVLRDIGGKQRVQEAESFDLELRVAALHSSPQGSQSPLSGSLGDTALREERAGASTTTRVPRRQTQPPKESISAEHTPRPSRRGARPSSTPTPSRGPVQGGRPDRPQTRLEQLEAKAREGDVTAQFDIGQMLSKSDGDKKPSEADLRSAARWFRTASDAGHVGAKGALADLLLKNGAVGKTAEEAARLLLTAAEASDAKAAGGLGSLYAQGLGVRKDDVEAVRWYRIAATAGDAASQYNLFVSLATGRGVLQNNAEALQWLHKAASGSLPQAQATLAGMYEKGAPGITKDEAKAADWYTKAGIQGHADSLASLAVMRATGRGVKQSQSEANKLYEKAAAQGHGSSQANLGLVYRNGWGVTRNDKKAANLFLKAAEQDVGLAQFHLAAMLDSHQENEGVGLMKNDTEAASWYKKVATTESQDAQAFSAAEAQYRLGQMFVEGRGVPRNRKQALRWLTKAADEGHPRAVLRASQLRREAKSAARSLTELAADEVNRTAPMTIVHSPSSYRVAAEAAALPPPVYGQASTCPFAGLDLVLYTGLRDMALLPYLSQSLRLFLPCYGRFHAIGPAAEMPLLLPQLAAAAGERLRIYPEEELPWLSRLSFPFRISYTALHLDELIQRQGEEAPKHLAFIDSDVVLAYPVTCRSLFDPATGKPWAFYWPHIVWGNPASLEKLFGNSISAEVAVKRVGSFMTYFPQVYPLEVLGLVRRRLRSAYGGSAFEDAYQAFAAEFGSFDIYSLLGHAAYYDARSSMSFVSCGPAAEISANGEDRCSMSAHVGVHVPYPWHHCVDHGGPICGDTLTKFEPSPRDGEVGRPSEAYLLAAADVLHRGLCFARHQYGGGASTTPGCDDPPLGGGSIGAATAAAEPHWRVWAYRNGQRGLPLRTISDALQELVENNRTRSTCGL